MEDVTGFNQRNEQNDGPRLIELGLKKLGQRYSDHIVEIIRMMLKFEEPERPSFIEMAKLVLTTDTIAPVNPLTKKTQSYGSQVKINQKSKMNSTSTHKTESVNDLATQCELFRSYATENHLYMNQAKESFWFEYGGNKIGKLEIEGSKLD